ALKRPPPQIPSLQQVFDALPPEYGQNFRDTLDDYLRRYPPTPPSPPNPTPPTGRAAPDSKPRRQRRPGAPWRRRAVGRDQRRALTRQGRAAMVLGLRLRQRSSLPFDASQSLTSVA